MKNNRPFKVCMCCSKRNPKRVRICTNPHCRGNVYRDPTPEELTVWAAEKERLNKVMQELLVDD